MKKEIKYAAFVISLIIFAAASFKAQDNPLPTLRGEAAIEKLKQNGQYESLSEAVKAARKEGGQTETAANAVGQTAKLIGSDGANGDNFGFSVAIDGNTAVAGAWGDDAGTNSSQGSVFVFVRNGTVWTEQQKLTASDGAATDGFGVTVALDGDTIIVGAWHDQVGGNGNQGTAYVFVRSGTTWTEQQKLTASDGAALDEFGKSVAIEGDTIIVGAFQNNADRGAAYVFVRSGSVWSEQQKLTASDGAPADNFSSVAISGDTVLVGASGDDVGANADQGSAYVFVRNGTVWTQQQKLVALDGAANDNFGLGARSVAIDGDTAVVGANNDDVGVNSDQGSTYVFVRSGTTWTQQAQLFASDGAAGSNFGSVAIEGDTLIVGAAQANFSHLDQGTAYVFVRSATTWTEQQKLTASDGAEADNFGFSVAIDGNKIFIGSYKANIGMENDQGVAYVFISKVFVSGRILTASGIGVSNANVQMTLANGETLTTRSSSFGYYRFDGIEADQTVTISVSSKRFQFTPQMVQVNDNLTDVDIIAQP